MSFGNYVFKEFLFLFSKKKGKKKHRWGPVIPQPTWRYLFQIGFSAKLEVPHKSFFLLPYQGIGTNQLLPSLLLGSSSIEFHENSFESQSIASKPLSLLIKKKKEKKKKRKNHSMKEKWMLQAELKWKNQWYFFSFG